MNTFSKAIIDTARQQGAQAAAFVTLRSTHYIDRFEQQKLQSSQETHDESRFFAQFESGQSQCLLAKNSPLPTYDDALEAVRQCVSAAKLAHAWQMPKPPENLNSLLKAKAQANALSDLERSNADVFMQKRLADLADSKLRCRELLEETTTFKALAPSLDLSICQTSQWIEEDISVDDGTFRQRRLETKVSQSIGQKDHPHRLKLPDFIQSATSQLELDPWPKTMLKASDLVKGLSASRASNKTLNAEAHFGIVLSPWALSALLKASLDLGFETILSSKTLSLESMACPKPVSSTVGRSDSFALRAVDSKLLSPTALMSSISSGALLLDAPSLIRRKSQKVVDIRFAVVASIKEGFPDDYYPKLSFEFDLKSVWQKLIHATKSSKQLSFGDTESVYTWDLPYVFLSMHPKLSNARL